jgi:DNA-nicking Smr family endonuclease
MTKKRGSQADADDADHFRAAMAGVKPLSKTQTRVHPAGTTARPRVRRAAAAPASGAELPLIGSADVGSEESLSFRRAGVRDSELRRLRRGLYPIEGELDLHGLNQAGARDMLAEFIAISRHAGRRCVRIIHGKGMRSGGRGAVLKSAVNDWLRRHREVTAFCSARTIDGGAGALYVLLRA